MKKIILLLTICLAYVYADAQTIDKKLLNGKWMLYSMGGDGQIITRDSMEQGIAGLISQKRAKHPEAQMSTEDSLAGVKMLKEKFKDLFKTYSVYNENGTCTMFSGINPDENGNLVERTGTYVWSGDNKIIETVGSYNPEAYVIVSLTADKLVISSDNKSEQKKNLRMVFVK